MITGPREFDPEQEYDFLNRLDETFGVEDDAPDDLDTMQNQTDQYEKDTLQLQGKSES